MMKLIATVYGAEFIGIFQPIIINKSEKNLTFEEKVLKELVLWTDLKVYQMYQYNVIERIQDIDYLYDLTKLFYDEKICIFRDLCHLTEEGNRILCNAIYGIIREMMDVKS